MKTMACRMYIAFVVWFVPCLASMSVAHDLTSVTRSIRKEPRYVAEPHYSLLVIGSQAEHRSWIVMDGSEVLYFDRNGNGDLTEAEDRIACDAEATKQINMAANSAYSGMNVFPIGVVAGVKLRLDFWVRNRSFVPTDEWQKANLSERDANNWQNATLWRLTEEEGQAQIPFLLAATPADAQITHLGGPLAFALKRDAKQRLEPWPKVSIFDVNIGTHSLPPRNYKHKLFAPLTEWEVPRELHPIAHFTFPPKIPGAPGVELSVELDRRCCGDTLFAKMTVPHDAGEGKAKVTLTYAAWKDREVQPTTFEVPIGGDLRDGDTAQSFVMFKSGQTNSGLDEVFTALRKRGLTVQKIAGETTNEGIVVSLKKEGSIAISLHTGTEVLETSRALGAGTAHEAALARSDARYEIGIYPADLITEAKETVSKIHAALAAECNGIVYTTWDRQFSARRSRPGLR